MGKRTLSINDLMNFIESNKNIIFKSESEKKRMISTILFSFAFLLRKTISKVVKIRK